MKVGWGGDFRESLTQIGDLEIYPTGTGGLGDWETEYRESRQKSDSLSGSTCRIKIIRCRIRDPDLLACAIRAGVVHRFFAAVGIHPLDPGHPAEFPVPFGT